MGTGAGEQERAPMGSNPESIVRQSRERGQSAEEGLFLAEERKNALPLPNPIFKCGFFKFLIFGELRPRGRCRCSLDFGREDGDVPEESHWLELRSLQNNLFKNELIAIN